jgi:hypothetical protein
MVNLFRDFQLSNNLDVFMLVLQLLLGPVYFNSLDRLSLRIDAIVCVLFKSKCLFDFVHSAVSLMPSTDGKF